MSQSTVSVGALSRRLRSIPGRIFVFLAAVLVVLISTIGMLPAMAALSAALTLEKLVDKSVVVPGETAVYELKPGCDSPTTLCENGVLTDEIPEPLVVEDVQVVGGGASEVDRDGNNITVRFLDVHTNGAIGLKDGSTPTVYITVRLPQSTPPEMSGTVLTNSAEVTADNADPKQADVDSKLEVPDTLGAVVDKARGADSVPTGTTQDISLSLTGIANNSDTGANALELREPSDDFNPFETVAITELKGVTLPEDADIGQIFVTTKAGETADEASASPALRVSIPPKSLAFVSCSPTPLLTARSLPAEPVARLNC